MIDGRFRFDNYVVGSANRLAVSAARAVAESPGSVYNPLFIYSSSGLGKTHLMGALGFAVRSLHPELTVEYVTLDDFVDQLHSAIANGQADTFKRRFQGAGVLLLDDVQFLTGRVETQSEMLRIFNALTGSGRQIVMTSDRAPNDITDIDQRLLTRLSGGLIVDIGAPDFETRVAILRHKCAERNITFASGVLEDLARVPARSVRELQGALNRLVAQRSVDTVAVVTPDVTLALHGAPDAPVDADEFESFLSDLAAAVAETVEEWRVRLGESIARWSGEGFRTGVLERALELPEAPDVDGLEARFASACERLRSIESEAIRLDASFASLPVFRDPERLADAEDLLQRAYARREPPPAPRPGLTMESMVPAPANQLALRAAVGVVSEPGAHYNPLVIVGPNGSGKTHLLHAMGNAMAASVDGERTVACTDADRFSDELIAALQSDTVDRWRARYRAADVLLFDDVHRLAGKERTQEELFHLFNALHDAGRQVVLASAIPPSQLTDIAQRLRSRFDGGLVVEIGRVGDADRAVRHTPGAAGDEAAAPTIELPPARPVTPRRVSPTDPFAAAVALHAPHPTPPSAATALATGDVVDPFFLDIEKVVTDWPDIDGCVVEDVR